MQIIHIEEYAPTDKAFAVLYPVMGLLESAVKTCKKAVLFPIVIKGGSMYLFSKNRFLLASSICLLLMNAWLWFEVPHVIAQVSIAPINPHFLEYQQNLQRSIAQDAVGFIPTPLNLSYLNGKALSLPPKPVDVPSSYDLRKLGKLPPIKDQGTCNSDWAFATFGSLETSLFPSETWDFSENNLKNTHGFDFGHCEGGNAITSTAYLARWSGPMGETNDPYNPLSNASPSELKVKKHIQEVLIIPGRANSLDNENIKQAIMTYGAVYTSMYFRYNYYSIAHKTYYYCYDTSPSNHSVAIVGWDDDFDGNKFSIYAPGNGAFIVRNSLGRNWGEDGYFYVSYYDSKIGKENYVFSNAESTTNYYRIYQYDPLGWVSSLGYGGTNAWFGNIFTAMGDELLKAVSFYVASPNSSYEIYVYLNADSGPTSGSLSTTQTGTIVFPGYHTVHLDNPTIITLKQKFSVLVKLTTPGYDHPIPVEYPITGYSSRASANAGESYISSDGVTWEDLTSSISNGNVCLKAFTVYINPSPDFDGDGNTDVATYDVANGWWFLHNSGDGSHVFDAVGVGDGSRWKPVPGDYDGDGKADVVVYDTQDGWWFFHYSSGGYFYDHIGQGGTGYAAVPGDYDGDWVTDIAVYDETNGNWFIKNSKGDYGFDNLGGSGWVAVPADYDGDGKTDVAVYNVANGWWYLHYSNDGSYVFDAMGVGGGSQWEPIPGDYDGDGKTDVAVYDTEHGWWLFHYSSGGYFYDHIGQGGTGYAAVPGDYDGDGVTDMAVYNETNGYWYVKYSNGGYGFDSLGGSGSVPVNLPYLFGSGFY